MPTYEPSVITLPAGQTHHLIEKLSIYSIPADSRAPLAMDRYYCFRAANGQMNRIYSLALELGPMLPSDILIRLQQAGPVAFPQLSTDQTDQLRNYILGIEHGIRQGRIKAGEHQERQRYYFLAARPDDELPPHTGPTKPGPGPMNYTRDELLAGGRLAPRTH